MSKTNSLPSIDGGVSVPTSTPPVQKRTTKRTAKPKSEDTPPRRVDFEEGNHARLSSYSKVEANLRRLDHRARFQELHRKLQDAGAKLNDGEPVFTKASVIIWLTENTEL